MKDLMRHRTAISEDIATLLNRQIQLEAQSSGAYLAMAAWCDANGFENSANFFYAQSNEERVHMLKIFKYMADMGASPVSPVVKETNHDYSTLREVFETALEQEISVSDSINHIVAACRKANDFPTEELMRWFVTEQVEEEFIARRAIELLDMLSSDQNGLIMFDERVSKISYSKE